ncbi:MAG: hypothetical protein RL341_1182 [Pseudomonadota bacterium]
MSQCKTIIIGVDVVFANCASPIVKLHAETRPFANTVSAIGQSSIDINGVPYSASLVVAPEGDVHTWPVARWEDLTEAHFEALAQSQPELVVLGTGAKQRFVHPRLTAALAAKRIGLEIMDTAAACRTYNILMSEGRKVIGAFILETYIQAKQGTV